MSETHGRRRAAPPADGGESVPGYRDLRMIGQGGFAVVYQAVQEGFERPVALKILRQGVDEDVQRRFLREVRITSKLTGHPYVVTVLDAGATPTGRPYLTTEMYERGSLADRLAREGPLPITELAVIGAKIAEALSTAHGAGILHRDVKPNNILINRYGEPALADFGVAWLLDSMATATVLDTFSPFHAAPEVVTRAAPGPASDVYSLGSTLYHLATGSTPFGAGGEPLVNVLWQIVNTQPEPLDDRALPGFAAVIARSMAKDQGQRYQNAADFAAALRVLTPAAETASAQTPATPASTEALTMELPRVPKSADPAFAAAGVPGPDAAAGAAAAGIATPAAMAGVAEAAVMSTAPATGMAAADFTGEAPVYDYPASPVYQRPATPPPAAADLATPVGADTGADGPGGPSGADTADNTGRTESADSSPGPAGLGQDLGLGLGLGLGASTGTGTRLPFQVYSAEPAPPPARPPQTTQTPQTPQPLLAEPTGPPAPPPARNLAAAVETPMFPGVPAEPHLSPLRVGPFDTASNGRPGGTRPGPGAPPPPTESHRIRRRLLIGTAIAVPVCALGVTAALVLAPSGSSGHSLTADSTPTASLGTGKHATRPSPSTSPSPSASPSASASPSDSSGGAAQSLTPVTDLVTGYIPSGVEDRCLDNENADAASGNPVDAYTCTSTPAQTWTLRSDGTLNAMGLCLTPSDGASASGTGIVVEPCMGVSYEKWTFQSDHELVDQASSLCLTVPGATTKGGVQLTITACTDAADQMWGEPAGSATAGRITVDSTSQCLDDYHSITTAGNAVDLATCNGTGAQNWTVGTDGTLQILGVCAEPAKDASTSGTHVVVEACDSTDAYQQWLLQPNGIIVNLKTGEYLEIPSGSTASGTDAEIATWSGASNQLWGLP